MTNYTDTNPRGPALGDSVATPYGIVREGRFYSPENGMAAVLGDDFAMAQVNRTRAHDMRVREAARLYADVLNGRIEPIFLKEAIRPHNPVLVEHLMRNYGNLYRDSRDGRQLLGLRETMSVTDYQALFVDVLDRMYYGFYNAYPIINKPLVRTHQLRDFRVVSRYMLDGAVSPYLPLGRPNSAGTHGGDAAAPWPQTALSGPVPQDNATFPTTNTAPVQYTPLAYGSGTAVNWRAFVNDDLGIFRDLADRLAIQGNRGISKFITSFFASSAGLNASLFTAGYRNLITPTYGALATNPPLGIQGLMDALKVIAAQRDSSGDPIQITGKMYLVYGPSQIAAANNCMNMLSVYLSNEGGNQTSANNFPQQFLQANNWVIQGMTPIMDPYLPIVASGAAGSIANTLWFIVIDPGAQNRPAVEVGFLNGFETPQMFQKVPNTMRMGGGVDPQMGDFYSMDQEMKIIGVMGGTAIDGRSVVGSTGAGT